MATTIVPDPMLEDAVLGQEASHINHPVLTAPSMEERASKRARANKATGKSEGRATNVPFRKRPGCLSELPTMPLDILYEVGGILVCRCNILRLLLRSSDTSRLRTCSRLAA
jgi:hypothetical protein